MRCRIVDMDVIYKNAGLSYQIMFISLVYSVPLRLDMDYGVPQGGVLGPVPPGIWDLCNHDN